MTVVTIGCGFLFPKININADMTRYLPSDSRMREGLDTMKRSFPQIDMNALVVKAMFEDVDDPDSLGRKLAKVEGISGILAREQKDRYTLYRLSVEKDADPKAAADTIKQAYGDKVTVETNANSNMPENMVSILLIGSALVFGILFLMCSSFLEALLFLIAIGMAVVINMGTNALLPSVSMMTNTIVAVLQLILSMDYSIILMNRYRQTLATEQDIDRAMSIAIRKASPSILSSSFTTIVGLLALVFMKFKIGLDLGTVLAKGVLCSLISIYTILPALILAFDKGIKATEKKVPLIKTDGIASFEMKYRFPLAAIFLVIFIGSCLLSQRTELSYASIWESRINDVFHPQNMFSVIYKTKDEDKVIALADSISSREKVMMVLSYPSLLKKKHTVKEMLQSIDELTAMLPEKPAALADSTLLSERTLRVLYYAKSHPVRREMMDFSDIMAMADEASSAGLLPAGMDIDTMIAKYSQTEVDKEDEAIQPNEDSTEVVDVAEIDYPRVLRKDEEVNEDESLRELAVEGGTEVPEDLSEKYRFTPENISKPLTSVELAAFLGFSRSQASTLYSMAGKKGRKATMSAQEFINYMTHTVIRSKFLRKFINDAQVDGLLLIEAQMDSVMRASAMAESLAANVETAEPQSEGDDDHAIVTEAKETKEEEKSEETVPEDPVAILAQFAADGNKVTAQELFSMLSDAGIDVSRGMIDLLYMYFGSRTGFDESQTMSLAEMIDFLTDEVAVKQIYSPFIGKETREALDSLKSVMAEGISSMRTEDRSMAAVVTGQELESEEVFGFVDDCHIMLSEALGNDYYLIGESVMYKEMSDGFRHELLILTLLTVISIFVIVALTFKSALIPTILVMTVLCGVYVNVIVSGLGGRNMLYLAYLIVQSILMGATIDYGILFTNYYLDMRHNGLEAGEALKGAYRGSIHTIMTSGLIIICAPYIMSMLLPDPAISSILSSLSFGAMAAIMLILFVLPATLASCDKLIVK